MRENRPYGLEGGGTGATGPSYPYLSSAPPGQRTFEALAEAVFRRALNVAAYS